MNNIKHFSQAGSSRKSFTLVVFVAVLLLVLSMNLWFACSSGDKENQTPTLPQPPKQKK